MPQLTSTHLTSIATFCEPFCRTQNERQTLIDTLFVSTLSKPDIDISGAPLEFSRRLIFRLCDYGEIASGQPALWALLEIIHSQVGVDRQAQIDTLKEMIFAEDIPAADYIVTTEGGKFIFISYSRANNALVDRLRADLQAAGINLWIDRIGLKVGTPNWEDALRDAIERADGVLLVASPTSRRSPYVRDEVAIAQVKRKKIYPVWAEGDEWTDSITMGLGATQYVDLRGDKYADELKKLIETLGGTMPAGGASITPTHANQSDRILPVPPPDFVPRNPYRGLSAFRATDRADFFGREMFVTELIKQIQLDPRLLAVIGASGSGKSSVVMAGLLPRLRDGKDIPKSNHWVYLDPFVPGKHPIEALSIALAKHLPQKAQAAIDEDLLHPSTRGLHRLAKQISETRLVLYIDQFEELFTQTERDDERRQFIDLITTASNEAESTVTVILTLRADFYDRPLQYADLGTLVETHSKAILPLTLADVYDVILKPAALPDVRLTFEPGLAEDMIFSVKGEAGALPLLQFTLDQLFQRCEGLHMTRAAYEALGGVRGALANHAETIYQALDAEGARLARGLFLRLIEPGATEQDTTRRRAHLSELSLTDSLQTDRLRRVMDTFIQARLLTADSLAGEDTIEVSHEALIREWGRLKGWLTEARADVMVMKRIASDADEWARKGQSEDTLYRGRRLREAQDWIQINTPSVVESAFITASAQAEQAQIAGEERRKEELQAAAERADIASAEAKASTSRAEQQRRRARIAIGFAAAIITLAVAAGMFAAGQISDAGNQVANANATLAPIPNILATADARLTAASDDVNYAADLLREVLNDAATQSALRDTAQSDAGTSVANANRQVANATATLGYVQDQGTQVANEAIYFGIERARIGTLSAGAVIIPPGTLTPDLFLPTLTGVAKLRTWEPQIIRDDFGIEMVEVPPGCFMMGSVAGGDEVPIHEQCFETSFYIDRYEVTQAQFEALDGVMGRDITYPGDQRPVEGVTWFEARDFCRKKRHLRLPTEREWEYAARGPDSLAYPWGNLFVPENVIYNRTAEQGPADVMNTNGKPARPNGASWVGALDMSGNVYEWTSTRYDDLDYWLETHDLQGLFPYPYRLDDGREEDETYEEYKSRWQIYTLRVVRGGSWSYTDTALRGSARSWLDAGLYYPYVGFRCARSS